MPDLKRKAYAYITYEDRLLVFSHPHAPEAGIQVPGGTLNDDERPEDAVTREAREETGLTGPSFDISRSPRAGASGLRRWAPGG